LKTDPEYKKNYVNRIKKEMEKEIQNNYKVDEKTGADILIEK